MQPHIASSGVLKEYSVGAKGFVKSCQGFRQAYFTEYGYYFSQFTVETYCFADGRCLFKQPQSVIYSWNQYDESISKKCRSVRLSVCNANKKSLLLLR